MYNVPSGSIHSRLQVNQFFGIIVVVKMFSQLHQALTIKAASRKSKSRSPYQEIDDHDGELTEACQSNYRNHQRRASSFADHHKEIIMNASIQPPRSKEVYVRNRDTGFPEPLCHGTSSSASRGEGSSEWHKLTSDAD